MTDIIVVEALTKRYGDFTAVNGISFSVHQGETFGILGPNGAGKTTTLEMIEGLKGITEGSVRVADFDVRTQPHEVKHRIGVQLQASTFFDNLNLVELIETFASLYGRKVDARAILREVQLEDKAKQPVKALSGGQKQRLSIASALVNEPAVLFLDEPTTGLDPQARRNLWGLIRQIKARGTTIVLTTHYMEEAEVLCERIAIMDQAKIVALDTTSNLIQSTDAGSQITFHTNQPWEMSALQALPGVQAVELEDHAYRLVSNDAERTMPALYALAHARGGDIFHLQLKQATLEDVFLKLTGHSLRE